MKQQFYLDLKRAYRNAQQDSIILISFSPKSEEGTHFSGQVWLDAEDQRILKIKLSCPDDKRHPFVPIFPDDDQIQKMELFMKEVDRGENIQALKQWNGWVKAELGIDNWAIFELVAD